MLRRCNAAVRKGQRIGVVVVLPALEQRVDRKVFPECRRAVCEGVIPRNQRVADAGCVDFLNQQRLSDGGMLLSGFKADLPADQLIEDIQQVL